MRIKYIKISSQVLVEFLKLAAENRLPDDARSLRATYDAISDSYRLVVESKEFDEVPEGSPIPQYDNPVVSQDFVDILRGRRKS